MAFSIELYISKWYSKTNAKHAFGGAAKVKSVKVKKYFALWKDFWGSTKLSNIIAAFSVIVSVISIYMANKAMQTVNNNIQVESAEYIQTGTQITNNGINVEDADFISKDNDKEMMDKAYGAVDILRLVDENPNLSFCLLWHGSQEEYEATDWDKMPPNIKIEKYDEETNTFTMTYN